ncbi:unnamed protein product [Diatraea saccharalis]|uniref:Uncharacterized protein n=1 Tax=Diatraea saccharalis TaxID=40085 RepID=A0A9N9WHM5_9NEOP|nr:unnamed protein product [Diatraea saccharalis]
MNMEVDSVAEIKRHNSFTSPNNKRPPITRRVGRERCHSYNHTPEKRSLDSRLAVPRKLSMEQCMETDRAHCATDTGNNEVPATMTRNSAKTPQR